MKFSGYHKLSGVDVKKNKVLFILDGITFISERTIDREGSYMSFPEETDEDLFHPVPRRLVIYCCFDRFCQRTEDALVLPAVCVQSNSQNQIVKRIIDPVNDIKVKSLRTCNAPICISICKKPVSDPSDKDPEDIAYAKVYPYRIFSGCSSYLDRII